MRFQAIKSVTLGDPPQLIPAGAAVWMPSSLSSPNDAAALGDIVVDPPVPPPAVLLPLDEEAVTQYLAAGHALPQNGQTFPIQPFMSPAGKLVSGIEWRMPHVTHAR